MRGSPSPRAYVYKMPSSFLNGGKKKYMKESGKSLIFTNRLSTTLGTSKNLWKKIFHLYPNSLFFITSFFPIWPSYYYITVARINWSGGTRIVGILFSISMGKKMNKEDEKKNRTHIVKKPMRGGGSSPLCLVDFHFFFLLSTTKCLFFCATHLPLPLIYVWSVCERRWQR